MSKFILKSKFSPTGDQPQAIEKLTRNIIAGEKEQVLLGVTGSGKTFTLANVIAKIQKPTLVISHNKTLAAQLYQEFKDFFPNNAAHYFVSYYDYYQPEAYLPSTDTYIEKDARINETIDRLRHAATQDLAQRKDIIVVASVSCIYNIGSPENYQKMSVEIKTGQKIKRQDFLRDLVALQYQRNDGDFQPGTFRARGEVIEIFAATGEEIFKIEFSDDSIEKITRQKTDGKNFEIFNFPASPAGGQFSIFNLKIFPAKFWVSEEQKIEIAITGIKNDLEVQLAVLKKQNKLLEAKRLNQRTSYDIEMMQNAGYCHGIENYSRYFESREPGSPPFTLFDHFAFSNAGSLAPFNDFLVIIDESHMTIPQLNAMYNTDKARKDVLIDYGFRLPSCLDNRPLKFSEFEKKAGQVIYVSATPGSYESSKCNLPDFATTKSLRAGVQSSKLIVEQLVRPTGLLEPEIKIKPTNGQIKDLVQEIKKAKARSERVLAITLTKRMAEELSDYLKEQGIKAQYLHAEIKTLERPEILNKLRKGGLDVIVGINLLREGLDLPEVALIAILDADKEGFLRNETTLIQTMGRAARHPKGRVILYADTITGSMKRAMAETERRRAIQSAYNRKHNITPKPIVKPIKEWLLAGQEKEITAEFGAVHDINLLEKEMKTAAANLDFERAAELRDLINELKVKSSK